MPSMRNARSKVKKRKKKATVDLNVQMSNRNVKMNQPCFHSVSYAHSSVVIVIGSGCEVNTIR